MSFVEGELYERTIETPAGRIDVIAEIFVHGKQVELRDIAVYPNGAGRLTVSPAELLTWARFALVEVAEQGFEELRALGWIDRIPRFLAAEVSGSLTQAMADHLDMPRVCERAGPTVATSIGAAQATHQGVVALRASDGRSVFVDDTDILAWQAKLARIEGVYAESSAVATLPAIERLRAVQ